MPPPAVFERRVRRYLDYQRPLHDGTPVLWLSAFAHAGTPYPVESAPDGTSPAQRAKGPTFTAAATVGACALLAATSPVGAHAASMVDTIRSIDIIDGTVRSRDIKDDRVRSADIKDGTLLGQDFQAGVLTGGGSSQAPSTVTELRSWTVHIPARTMSQVRPPSHRTRLCHHPHLEIGDSGHG